jgi:hypothetical protein
MKSFEEILREGKDKAKSAPWNPSNKWREHINLLMELLHSLNDMYGTTDEHQLKIKSSSCNDCGMASFVIAVRDISNREQIIKFHRGRWLATEDGNYYCERCKKGK